MGKDKLLVVDEWSSRDRFGGWWIVNGGNGMGGCLIRRSRRVPLSLGGFAYSVIHVGGNG